MLTFSRPGYPAGAGSRHMPLPGAYENAMTYQQIFLLVVAAAMFIGLPIFGLYSAWRWLRLDPKERGQREGGGGTMLGVEKLTRPSVEHQVEAETPIVKEDQQDGE